MTIEEAMCYLHNPEDEDCYNAKEVEAYKIIIKTLKQNPYDTKELEKVRQELLERGDETISFRDLVERFDNIDKEYNGQLWNLLQIYSNINILIGKEPCDDAISRESVLKLFATHDGKYLYKAIQELPPVTPQQDTVHFDFKLYEAGLMDMPKEMIKVLNKIRAEIDQIEINGHIKDVECFSAGINAALTVIEKYKEENEDKDEHFMPIQFLTCNDINDIIDES